MWYFTWVLGVLFACAAGIINVMWLESARAAEGDKEGER
jgi:cytochrome bd-I ubiquinol oxidase subunit X